MISIKNSIKSLYIIILGSILFSSLSLRKIPDQIIDIGSESHYSTLEPTPLEMHNYIEKYANKYNVPLHIAYNVAFMETRYKGPFDWSYKPDVESLAGAVGPMQVMVETANYINNRDVSKKRLKEDIEINIETSMKLLSKLYGMYNNWGLACGSYNTGQPILNDYALYCINNKDYKSKWLFYQIK